MKQSEMPRIKKGSILEVNVFENIGTKDERESPKNNYTVIGYYQGLRTEDSMYSNSKDKGIYLTSNLSRDGGNNIFIGFEDHKEPFLIAKSIKIIRGA